MQGVDPGEWQRAPEDVIKTRKIIKTRRTAPLVAASGTTSNPFAAISLPVPTAAADPPAVAQVRQVECYTLDCSKLGSKALSYIPAVTLPLKRLLQLEGVSDASAGWH